MMPAPFPPLGLGSSSPSPLSSTSGRAAAPDRAHAARFTNLDLLANVVAASPGRRRHLPPVFALAALAALLVALARPQTIGPFPEIRPRSLAMDSSASMTATDVEPTRLDAAKSAASSFLDKLPARFRVGLVSFSSGASASSRSRPRIVTLSALTQEPRGEGRHSDRRRDPGPSNSLREDDPQGAGQQTLFAAAPLVGRGQPAGIDPLLRAQGPWGKPACSGTRLVQDRK